MWHWHKPTIEFVRAKSNGTISFVKHRQLLQVDVDSFRILHKPGICKVVLDEFLSPFTLANIAGKCPREAHRLRIVAILVYKYISEAMGFCLQRLGLFLASSSAFLFAIPKSIAIVSGTVYCCFRGAKRKQIVRIVMYCSYFSLA